MTKAGTGDWKTPLGYYERAIEELRKAREEIQTELENLRELQASYATLKVEFQASQTELQTLKGEFHASQTELQTLKGEFETTNERLAITQQTANEAQARAATAENFTNEAQTELKSVKAELQTINEYLTTAQQTTDKAQARADTACSEVEFLKVSIQNGSIVAQKALMLRGRDENHWMKFNFVAQGIDVFELWTSHDDKWHNAIKIGPFDRGRRRY